MLQFCVFSIAVDKIHSDRENYSKKRSEVRHYLDVLAAVAAAASSLSSVSLFRTI